MTSIPSSVVANRLLFRAIKAGRAYGFPSSPSFCTAILILERLLFPKSFSSDSKSFASAIDIKEMKQTRREKNQTGRVNTLSVLESVIEQTGFGRKT